MAVAIGLGLTVIILVMVSEHPLPPETSRVTEYVPEFVNRCVGEVVVEVLFIPDAGSPKFQFDKVPAVDVLVKFVKLFTHTELALKAATGGAGAAIFTEVVLVQPLPSVIITEYDPTGRPVIVCVVCIGVEFQE